MLKNRPSPEICQKYPVPPSPPKLLPARLRPRRHHSCVARRRSYEYMHRRPFRRRRWRHCGWCVAMRRRHCPSMTSTYHAHPSRVVGTETRSVWRGAGTPRQEVDNQGSTERRLARSVGVLAPARQTQAMSILRHLRNGHFQSARLSPSNLSSAQACRVHLWNTVRRALKRDECGLKLVTGGLFSAHAIYACFKRFNKHARTRRAPRQRGWHVNAPALKQNQTRGPTSR